MIHVCRLDVGSRHVFDSADGINDVGTLASAIEQQYNISKLKQILLISGGEILDDNEQKLYRLSAGREESPIYLIDKGNVEKEQPPNIEMPLDNLNQDMKQEIETAIQMRPSYQTLLNRSQLAARVYDLGKNLHTICQSFYDDQYWQYQGFLALIANLDEFVSTFRKRQDIINDQFDKYLNNKTYFKDLMTDIDKYIDVLGNVRLLPQILSQIQLDINSNSSTNLNTGNIFGGLSCQSISTLPMQLTNNEITKQQQTTTENESTTLLEWIKSTDPQNKLNAVIDETKEMLTSFDSNFKWKELRTKINKLINEFEANPQMKEIEGLTKRLQDLNNFLDKSKKYLASQLEISDSFAANQERAASLKDESILQDLCKGHQRQLEIFKTNHSNMIEITRKISKAKLELIRVIHSRLNWVMQIQKKMADTDFQLQIYFKQLKRINIRLKLMEQLKKAPFIYVYSMKETIRRQNFSKIYKNFAKLFSELINRVFKNEMQKRELFDSKIAPLSQHFILSFMFRSLNDKVEPFLNETVFKFDNRLPNLDEQEVIEIENNLKSHISELKIRNSSSFSFSSTTSTTNTPSVSSASSSSLNTSSATAIILPSNQFESPSLSSSPNVSNSSSSKNNNNAITTTPLKSTKKTILNELPTIDLNKIDDDLTTLTNLIDFIQSNNYSTTSHQHNTSTTKQINNNYKHKIDEIKLKLNETKQLVKTYQLELKTNIDSILKQNDKTKSNFYSNLIDLLKSSSNSSSSSTISIDSICANEKDKQFSLQLLNHFKSCESENQKQINELKQVIETIKMSTKADKQTQFNEAIKRVTQEKDKQIEDFKQKEKQYLEQINSLQILLETATATANNNNNSQLPNDTVLISSSNDPIKSITTTTNNELENEDITQTKMKLRELMLMEKITQLEKQLSLFTTIPITNDYETIQLHSCNIDDLVIAVYSESYGSYKIIHKSSNYLHFVHSAIFKSHEQRLSFKNPNAINIKTSQLLMNSSPSSSSPINEMSSHIINDDISSISSFINTNNNKNTSDNNNNDEICSASSSMPNPLVKNSPSDNIHNIFLSEKQPQWFVGRVLVKEFCIARKENNRFRVPSGTRFYRVKLKPYNL